MLNEKLKPQQCAKLVALRRNSNGTKLHQSWVASIVNSKVASIVNSQVASLVNSQDASIDSKWNPELMLLHPCHHPAGLLTCIAATVMQCNSQCHHLTCMQCNYNNCNVTTIYNCNAMQFTMSSPRWTPESQAMQCDDIHSDRWAPHMQCDWCAPRVMQCNKLLLTTAM